MASRKKESWAQHLAKSPRLARVIPCLEAIEASSARKKLQQAKNAALAALVQPNGDAQ